MINKELSLRELAYKLLDRWPILVLGGITGGLLSLLLSQFIAPVYVGRTVIEIWIDRTRTYPLDERTEYYATLRVQDLLLSDETLLSALEILKSADQVPISLDGVGQFRDSIRLTRISERWELEVFSKDQDYTIQAAKAWGEASLHQLDQAIGAAWIAHEYQSEAFGIGCSPQSNETDSPIMWKCNYDSAERGEIEVEAYRTAIEASKGILPIFAATLVESATSPPSPVLQGRGVIVLSGIGIGMIVGIFTLTNLKPKGENSRREAVNDE